MAFQNITLRSGGKTVTGELVLESSNAYQVAVDGTVGVYLKDEWRQGYSNPFGGGYSDLLNDIAGWGKK